MCSSLTALVSAVFVTDHENHPVFILQQFLGALPVSAITFLASDIQCCNINSDWSILLACSSLNPD